MEGQTNHDNLGHEIAFPSMTKFSELVASLFERKMFNSSYTCSDPLYKIKSNEFRKPPVQWTPGVYSKEQKPTLQCPSLASSSYTSVHATEVYGLKLAFFLSSRTNKGRHSFQAAARDSSWWEHEAMDAIQQNATNLKYSTQQTSKRILAPTWQQRNGLIDAKRVTTGKWHTLSAPLLTGNVDVDDSMAEGANADARGWPAKQRARAADPTEKRVRLIMLCICYAVALRK